MPVNILHSVKSQWKKLYELSISIHGRIVQYHLRWKGFTDVDETTESVWDGRTKVKKNKK